MKNISENFGSLSLADIKDFTSLIAPLKSEQAEMAKVTKENFDKVHAFLPPEFSWSFLYELPVRDYLILQLAVMGGLEELERAHQQGENLFRFMLDDAMKSMQGEVPEWNGGHKGQFKEHEMFACAYAMQGWLNCLRLHGRYISEMIADVRNGNDPDDKMFFDILRIDPTAIGCPSFVARLSRAHLQGNTEFVDGLKLAIGGKPHSSLDAHDELRLVLQLMHEAESLNELKAKERASLFIHELKLYTKQGDSSRSLNRFIQRWLENKGCDTKS